ncbi:MAG: tetraacyldisaccharide 4'-kinase [Hyphomicrobiales bacterium]|nr:tetraacyldisaccharide 4'-kinase [Hyphomicrobiales bacterium]MDE2114594.1 tetraacyldisaccharide 4'-kinase [Hyphomicrobiales bacterium]
MRAPRFWQGPHLDWRAQALRPISKLYGWVAARHMGRIGSRLAVPVICIGNLTVGGTGKTPTVLALAQMLLAQGERVFILTRGFGGSRARGRNAAPIQVESWHTSAVVGDEPLLLAQVAPTIVATDRLAGARLAVARGASVILMDDGLQNSALVKDLTLAVVDGPMGFGNGLCLPAGPLRAPLTAQLPKVDAFVQIGPGRAGPDGADAAILAGKTVLRAQLVAGAASVRALQGRKLLAFAGIGRPQKFFDSLRACGLDIVGTREFADHHIYRDAEILQLQQQAQALGASLVTTTKDHARLGAPAYAQTLEVALDFGDGAAMTELLAQALGKGGPRDKS